LVLLRQFDKTENINRVMYSVENMAPQKV